MVLKCCISFFMAAVTNQYRFSGLKPYVLFYISIEQESDVDLTE